eukprot:5557778-Karenia_brevis.AAC.1
MEQLQNLVVQFAHGLRRLEAEEAQEGVQTGEDGQDTKQRARRATLRIALAANRASLVSCCEMALFIKCRAHCRKTYFPRQIYLSRAAYLTDLCAELLGGKDTYLVEAASE